MTNCLNFSRCTNRDVAPLTKQKKEGKRSRRTVKTKETRHTRLSNYSTTLDKINGNFDHTPPSPNFCGEKWRVHGLCTASTWGGGGGIFIVLLILSKITATLSLYKFSGQISHSYGVSSRERRGETGTINCYSLLLVRMVCERDTTNGFSKYRNSKQLYLHIYKGTTMKDYRSQGDVCDAGSVNFDFDVVSMYGCMTENSCD